MPLETGSIHIQERTKQYSVPQKLFIPTDHGMAIIYLLQGDKA
jgi:hypothetical protein